MLRDSGRAASSVIGVLLLVGVVVVVGGVVAVGALTFLDGTGAPEATASFDYEQTAAGLRMTPQAISTTVAVRLNGQDVATFDPESAGQSALLPTAPGDRITVVSTDEERSVLVDRTVDDRSEVGDFIAYYTFDGEDGDMTLEDQSGNGNDGTLTGEPGDWTGSSYEFDGDDSFTVSDIGVSGTEVDEFTVAVAYKQTDPGGGDDVSQLVEHQYEEGSNEWFLENRYGSDSYRTEFAVEFPDNQVASGYDYDLGERHVAVGTYDGSDYSLYVDGSRVGGGSHDDTVDTEEMRIGRDFESDIQYFNGEIYEVRLYYTAFGEAEVERITNAME